MQWMLQRIAAPDAAFYQQALQRQQQLTKPVGSLGQLELLACRLAAMQATLKPRINNIQITIFAADHGITAENISAFPQSVTHSMLENFVSGGAAISVLARQLRAELEIVDVGINHALIHQQVINARVARATENFLKAPAMTQQQLEQALLAGKEAVQRAMEKHVHVFIGGEMGIGNTTSATAIACALSRLPVALLTGKGTGLDATALKHKQSVIKQALLLHQPQLNGALAVLQHLGGFEIAALCAAYIYAAMQQMPVLVDGFIASVAALLAVRINAQVKPWLIFAHRSQEQGHQAILDVLGVEALLDLELRLGEASGAALALPLLQSACALHAEMATFAEAQVAQQN